LASGSEEPVVLHETNNTVVWLSPSPVVAKVSTRRESAAALVKEYEVASALAARGAPVAQPLPDSQPVAHASTGFMVTLWRRLEAAPDAVPSGSLVGESLRAVHEALALCDIELPDFRVGVSGARRALFDDQLMAALGREDLAFLRRAYESLSEQIELEAFVMRPLHGEPHDGNRILNADGLRWFDFENACRGPLEWDLTFVPVDVRATFPDVDTDLLGLLSVLNSALVATWCWVQARFPEMRRHGEHHLEQVRLRWPSKGPARRKSDPGSAGHPQLPAP
jgi:Ser/Thr protein kinase RdoA (MazF antagonist)